MGNFRSLTIWSAGVLFVLFALLSGCGGGGGGSSSGKDTLAASDIIGTWSLSTYNGTPASATLIIDSAAYTYSDSTCSESGTWSLSGNTLTTTPSSVSGSGCTNQNGQPYPKSISLSGSTLTISETGVTLVFQRQSLLTLTTGVVPSAIAVDANNVYISDFLAYGGDMRKVGINGGALTTLATGVDNSTAIAVDATSLYWVENTASIYDQGGRVKKASLADGTVTTLASGTGVPYTIAIDGQNVYFAEYYKGTVNKVGLNGGTVTTLVSGLNRPDHIVVNSSVIYWSDGAHIGAVNIDGTNPITLATISASDALAVDGNYVYWAEGAAVRKVPKTGGTVTDMATGLNNARTIAVDAANAYWFENDTNNLSVLKKMPLGGGAPVTVVSGLDNPSCIALDDAYIYWGEWNNTGPVKKITK